MGFQLQSSHIVVHVKCELKVKKKNFFRMDLEDTSAANN